jgi:aspartate/methionine/tyrosine aminotransferase
VLTADLQAIGKLAADRGLWILTDEIYSRITCGAAHDTVLRYGDPSRIVVLDGFNKTYAMTGWRLNTASCRLIHTAMARLQTNATRVARLP